MTDMARVLCSLLPSFLPLVLLLVAFLLQFSESTLELVKRTANAHKKEVYVPGKAEFRTRLLCTQGSSW